MKKLTILFLFLFPLGLLAQNYGSVKGKVFNDGDKKSMPRATVYVKVGGSTIGTTTDKDGNFNLKPLSPGVYNVHITYMGFREVILTKIRVNPDKITFLDKVYMEEEGIMQDPVVIKGRIKGGKLLDIEQPSKQTLADTDLKNIPGGKDPAKLLSSFSSDIMVSEVGNRVYVRGARNGTVLYVVDGVRVNGSDIGVPTGAISSMTVYTGGVPAKYGDFTGGVVVIETKGYFEIEAEHIANSY